MSGVDDNNSNHKLLVPSTSSSNNPSSNQESSDPSGQLTMPSSNSQTPAVLVLLTSTPTFMFVPPMVALTVPQLSLIPYVFTPEAADMALLPLPPTFMPVPPVAASTNPQLSPTSMFVSPEAAPMLPPLPPTSMSVPHTAAPHPPLGFPPEVAFTLPAVVPPDPALWLPSPLLSPLYPELSDPVPSEGGIHPEVSQSPQNQKLLVTDEAPRGLKLRRSKRNPKVTGANVSTKVRTKKGQQRVKRGWKGYRLIGPDGQEYPPPSLGES